MTGTDCGAVTGEMGLPRFPNRSSCVSASLLLRLLSNNSSLIDFLSSDLMNHLCSTFRFHAPLFSPSLSLPLSLSLFISSPFSSEHVHEEEITKAPDIFLFFCWNVVAERAASDKDNYGINTR